MNGSIFGDSTTVTTKENGWVADIPGSNKDQKVNAKAISAVPEMIDALIEANDYIIENAPDDIYPKELLDKLEQTLKKAGVEL